MIKAHIVVTYPAHQYEFLVHKFHGFGSSNASSNRAIYPALRAVNSMGNYWFFALRGALPRRAAKPFLGPCGCQSLVTSVRSAMLLIVLLWVDSAWVSIIGDGDSSPHGDGDPGHNGWEGNGVPGPARRFQDE